MGDDNVNNSSTTPEETQVTGLVARGEPGQYNPFPGDIKYGIIKSRPPTPNEMLENDAKKALGDESDGSIGCKDCGSCTETKTGNKKKKKPCCGCISMDYKWSYADIPSYEDCDSCDRSTFNRQWPFGGNRIQSSTAKRNPYLSSEAEEEESEDKTTLHQLESRTQPEVGIGEKNVKMCSGGDSAGDLGVYPQFPRDANRPWVGASNGRWDPISLWWGNTSSLCTNWSVNALDDYDEENTSVGRFRANYQSMYHHGDDSKTC